MTIEYFLLNKGSSLHVPQTTLRSHIAHAEQKYHSMKDLFLKKLGSLAVPACDDVGCLTEKFRQLRDFYSLGKNSFLIHVLSI